MSQGRKRWPSVSATRVALIFFVPVAVLVGARLVAWATTPKTWTSGETLTAADLNANFDSLNAQIVDKSSDQTIGGNKTFTSPIDVGLENLTFNVTGTLPPECVAGTSGYMDCKCPAGKTAIAGGGYAGANMFLDESRNPVGNSACATGANDSCWRVACANSAGTRARCTYVNVVCARIK